jgi:phosphohistidine phosphatase
MFGKSKTLLIMRNAHSNWDNPEWSDFERPLNSDGLKAAPFMGNVIFVNNLRPDLIISSTAKRAMQTAVLIKEVAEVKTKIEFSEKLYKASPATLLQVISELDNKFESVLLVGHYPGIEGLIRILSGEIQSMSAASIVKISLSLEGWSQIVENCGNLELILRPADLMERAPISPIHFGTNQNR